MNKKPVSYLQTDKRWGGIYVAAKGGQMNIGRAGCGPTSAAMLISTLTGKEVTPVDTMTWAAAHGHLEAGHGTNYSSYFQDQFAAYGLNCQMLNWKNSYGNPNHANHTKVKEMLTQGYYFIALMNAGLWTSGGHFVVVWWADNKIRINDPASTKDARVNGDPTTFFSQVRYYWYIDARAYNNPPPAEETQEGKNDTTKEGEEIVVKYEKLGNVPACYRPSIQKLMETGKLVGYNDPDPTRLDDNIIDVSEDFCRTVTVLDRLGLIPAPEKE